ncbi:MAG: hypothetical protein Q9162_004078 [Coniocarpon cinnabarinum]
MNIPTWARAELIGGLINGVFLVALCLSIFLDAIQRFVEPQEVSTPLLVLSIGGVGLIFNILGLFVFHQHSHGHDHDEEEHDHRQGNAHDDAEHSHADRQSGHRHDTHAAKSSLHPTSISWRVTDVDKPGAQQRSSSRRRSSISSNPSGRASRRSRARSMVDDIPIHPASWRNEIMKSARMTDADPDQSHSSDDETAIDRHEPNENSPLLYKKSSEPQKMSPHGSNVGLLNGVHADHKSHKHNQPKESSQSGHGHSHSDMNIRGLFLHVLGDALGNIGVMMAALFIWSSSSPWRHYADPAISLVITCIILHTAVPMCKDTAKPLLQATPDHIFVDDIKDDIESLDGVRSCHHIHVWALTPSKPIATLDVELDFDFQGENAARYMQLAKEIKSCLHGHGIHSSTIQPEFCLDPQHKATSILDSAGGQSGSSASTVQTAIGTGYFDPSQHSSPSSSSPHEHAACLLDCNDACITGKQCCGPASGGSGAVTPKTSERESHNHPRTK